MKFIFALFFVFSYYSEGALAQSKYFLSWSEFSSLHIEQKTEYIQVIREALIRLEATEVKEKGPKYYSSLFMLLNNYAHAARLDQTKCIYAGYLSHLYKTSTGRVACKRPLTTGCSNSKMLCNPALFGKNVCTSAGKFATKGCMKSAQSAEGVAKSLNDKDWQAISVISQYCERPLGYQKQICNLFYKKRLQALQKSKTASITKPTTNITTEASTQIGPCEDCKGKESKSDSITDIIEITRQAPAMIAPPQKGSKHNEGSIGPFQLGLDFVFQELEKQNYKPNLDDAAVYKSKSESSNIARIFEVTSGATAKDKFSDKQLYNLARSVLRENETYYKAKGKGYKIKGTELYGENEEDKELSPPNVEINGKKINLPIYGFDEKPNDKQGNAIVYLATIYPVSGKKEKFRIVRISSSSRNDRKKKRETAIKLRQQLIDIVQRNL